jgi:hypothetical protein
MGIPKEGGNTPKNHGLSSFEVLGERKGIGPRVQKPAEPKQQLSDADREAFYRMLRQPRRPIVAGGEAHIRNQRLLRKLDNEGDNKR